MLNNGTSLKEIMEKTKENEMELLGVEYEKETDHSEVADDELPYRVDDIRIEQKMISLFQMCHWIDTGKLELRPEYQRNLVWNERQKSLLIESLMLRIPIPAFYLDENADEKKTVIDGLQRLSTIHDFVNGRFALKGLQYLKNCENHTFEELDVKYKIRIEDTQFAVNILDVRCPSMVKFDVFRRINTGGITLNPQEVRNIMASPQTRSLLIEMSGCEAFLKATRGKVNDIRMGAQELCLKFIAYYRIYHSEKGFLKSHEVTKLLDQTILYLNQTHSKRSENYLLCFEESMEKCSALFGEKTFSKPQSTHLINRALFTSWSIVMSEIPMKAEQLMAQQQQAQEALERYLMIPEYYNAVTSSTSTKNSIQIQFDMAKRILEELNVW